MNLVQTIIPYHANILQMLMWNQWKTLKIPWNFLLLNGCGWTYMILTYVTLLANSFRLTANPPGKPCMLLHVTACLIHFFNFSRLHSKNMHFPRHNIMSGGIEPSKNACCRMHVARGPLRTLWLFPSPPLGPSPAVTGLVSMELPAHPHMYVKQPSQRTLKVAHSLWCNIIPSYK